MWGNLLPLVNFRVKEDTKKKAAFTVALKPVLKTAYTVISKIQHQP